jgi:glycerophosphoryl diester phosphodiesterase
LVSALSLILESGCAFANEADTLVIAHRGLASVHPPNSVAALLAAADAGANAVEADLQLIGDEVVLSHEATPACREGTGEKPTPDSLADFLRAEDGRYEAMFLEIKGTDENRAELARRIVAHVDDHGVAGRVVITGFDPDSLLTAREEADRRGLDGMTYGLKLAFDSGTSLSIGCTPMTASGTEADAYDHDFEWILWGATLIDRLDVQLAHAHDKRVATWSGESPMLIERAVELGVDGIYTDAPGFLSRRVE